MTNIIAGFLLGFGVAILIDYLMDKHKADKERADYMQAEIDALRAALMGEDIYDDTGDAESGTTETESGTGTAES